MKLKNILYPISILAILGAVYFLSTFFFRLDLTSDKRYSISTQTKELMSKIDKPLEIVVYLDGDLNPDFLRLKKATVDLFDELAVYSKSKLTIRFENPSLTDNQEQRNKNYTALLKKGIIPTALYERDKEGKSIEKIIFPWIEIKQNNSSIPVCLLKNVMGNSVEENINVSVENLEFEITDGIRRTVNKQIKKIAFIEGHGELTEAETYDVSKSLSRYFQIDRGIIATDASILSEYKAIIIAQPKTPFSEPDKYIIDQYIMNGGSVLWLIDGVKIARENLSSIGISPAMELDVNLNDQLFRYGIRINPVLLQDVQCVSAPINIAPHGASPQFESTPWYYNPLLLTSPNHTVTRNITEVKANFCSGIDLVGDNKRVNAQLLLATSNNTHITGTPSTIDLNENPKSDDKTYFNIGYVPVGVALEGNFDSNFANRMTPPGLTNTIAIKKSSVITRQIFIADGDIIRNEVPESKNDSNFIPLGYDRYMNQQYGNKDFILNAVLYLTDNDGWMNLRNRTLKLRLLNKKIINEDKLFWQLTNTLIPFAILILFGISYQFIRRRKYTKR